MKNKILLLILISLFLASCVGVSSKGIFGTGVSVALDPRSVGTQIDDSIMEGQSVEDISQNFSLNKPKKITLNKFGFDQNSTKIENLSNHINKFKKDKHSSVGLLKAVNRRKKLLEYLKKNKLESYQNVISKLNLRK